MWEDEQYNYSGGTVAAVVAASMKVKPGLLFNVWITV